MATSRILPGTVLLFQLLSTSIYGDSREELFENRIRPILAQRCFPCHGDKKVSSGLRVDSLASLKQGGESGAALEPGRASESLLMRAIRRQDDVSAMPPDSQQALTPAQVLDFERWIDAGAYWPATSGAFESVRHWALEPLRNESAPDVQNETWAKTSIDSFVLSKLEAVGARPSPPAERLAWIRRATFDLTGLPPTLEEIESFLSDATAQAQETVVNRLLDSPAYGEHWGRHWLDVVRYADTAGETADYPVPVAWRYRNYVIDSFNADKPYNEFLHEQIAGDILAGLGEPERYVDRTIATGYLAISRRFGFDSENYHHLTIQDTIDNLGQTVLGLSLGCARCHDHKFDAISMQDYYALYGVFASSRYSFPGSEQKQQVRALVPLLPSDESRRLWRAFERDVASRSEQLAALKQPIPRTIIRSLHEYDGDFELQAIAAGGSNGVLVPPWIYSGPISVTNAAQSPFQNVYPAGKVGASVPSGDHAYRIVQALYPEFSSTGGGTVYYNLDFRCRDAAVSGKHRIRLGNRLNVALTLSVAPDALAFVDAEQARHWADLNAGHWYNLQFKIDAASRSVQGTLSSPDAVVDLAPIPLSTSWSGIIDQITIESCPKAGTRSAVEFDNFAFDSHPFSSASTKISSAVTDQDLDAAVLAARIQELSGLDGDFELQPAAGAPSTPWNPGPNSAVRILPRSQSPFQNVFLPGVQGAYMPNRADYDGLGLTIAPAYHRDSTERLYVSFDFRCAEDTAGGGGSWRYYIGHGAGSNPAVELYFNSGEFFQRQADQRIRVASLVLGEWYQVQLELDLKGRAYRGLLASRESQVDFRGDIEPGWDGAMDYSFVDSYGHLGGVRPSLDVDNFHIGVRALLSLSQETPTAARDELRNRISEIEKLRESLANARNQVERSRVELQELLAKGPCDLAYGMSEGTPQNARLQLRGEPDKLGTEVPRGFLSLLGGGPLPDSVRGSGRRELAEWLTGPVAPLTARVMANRIWQYHFGRGIVGTPNDFGVRGLPPTHSELLDHLASNFINSGWSIKSLHRLIMLSATYGQACDVVAVDAALSMEDDQKLALYGRFARRRLTAEEIRDSILAISGELNREPGREHPFATPTSWSYSQHGPFSAVYEHNQRSVYLMVQRLKRHPYLALFDGADPNATTATRMTTTVPTQALFFLNDSFVHEKADAFASRMQRMKSDDRERVEASWRATLGRSPEPAEMQDSLEFLRSYREQLTDSDPGQAELRPLSSLVRSLFASNEFLHVD